MTAINTGRQIEGRCKFYFTKYREEIQDVKNELSADLNKEMNKLEPGLGKRYASLILSTVKTAGSLPPV